ncbi:MAG: rhodanese-like domain-containing protein [Gammaproteobacteria bacterium]|nr:rhodanese-like domain-containing protein [Gammaproteobacteria bacterium]
MEYSKKISKIPVITCIWFLLATIICTTPAIAETSPEKIEGSTLVNAEEFIELVGKIPELLVIDSRIPGDRKQGYVEGSISLPDVDTTCESLAKVIPKKESPTLFYCNGVKCGRSAKAVKIALSCGYSNIYWFRGGFEEWLAKGYPYLQE